jgi:Mg2+-importing ATPase
VLFVIRTTGNPFRSRPSPLLAATVSLVLFLGLTLPVSPLAASLGFVPLPAAYIAYLVVVTSLYLTLVQVVKSQLLRRLYPAH